MRKLKSADVPSLEKGQKKTKGIKKITQSKPMKQVNISIPQDLYIKFDKKIRKNSITRKQVLIDFIKDFLKN